MERGTSPHENVVQAMVAIFTHFGLLGEQGVVPPRSWVVPHFYNSELEEYTVIYRLYSNTNTATVPDKRR